MESRPYLKSALLSTLEPESAYIAFNLNLVSELAPLRQGCAVLRAAGNRQDAHRARVRRADQRRVPQARGAAPRTGKAVQVHIRLTLG